MSLKANKVLAYYIVGGIIFLTLKYLYKFADNDDLLFLTAPTNAVIALINESTWTYSAIHGFAHHSMNILIDKSCSGFNFFLLAANLFLFTILPRLSTARAKFLVIPISYACAYLFALFANTSRILISLKLESFLPRSYNWLHEAEGTFVYLSLLISAYLILNLLIRKHTTYHHENIA